MILVILYVKILIKKICLHNINVKYLDLKFSIFNLWMFCDHMHKSF